MNATRLTVAESTKLLKGQLAKAFPGTKFSVRGSRGTGYGWVSVSWIDGPTSQQVDAICEPWETERFDGMTDCMMPKDHAIANSGIRAINTHRDYSEEAIAAATAQLVADGWSGHEWAMRGAARAVCSGCGLHYAASHHHLIRAA